MWTWVNGAWNKRALVDYKVIDRCTKERLLNVKELRGATDRTSDHFLAEARVKMVLGLGKEMIYV